MLCAEGEYFLCSSFSFSLYFYLQDKVFTFHLGVSNTSVLLQSRSKSHITRITVVKLPLYTHLVFSFTLADFFWLSNQTCIHIRYLDNFEVTKQVSKTVSYWTLAGDKPISIMLNINSERKRFGCGKNYLHYHNLFYCLWILPFSYAEGQLFHVALCDKKVGSFSWYCSHSWAYWWRW